MKLINKRILLRRKNDITNIGSIMVLDKHLDKPEMVVLEKDPTIDDLEIGETVVVNRDSLREIEEGVFVIFKSEILYVK